MICDSFQIVGYKVKEWDTVAISGKRWGGGKALDSGVSDLFKCSCGILKTMAWVNFKNSQCVG